MAFTLKGRGDGKNEILADLAGVGGGWGGGGGLASVLDVQSSYFY